MTKNIVRSWALSLVGGALLVIPAARADIPPPEGYVETCTLEKQGTAENECVSCGTWHEAPNKCTDLHGPEGYTPKCRTTGATAWTEVLCRPKAGGAATPTPTAVQPEADKPATDDKAAPQPAAAEPTKSKCAGADLEGSIGLALALGALIVARRRKLVA